MVCRKRDPLFLMFLSDDFCKVGVYPHTGNCIILPIRGGKDLGSGGISDYPFRLRAQTGACGMDSSMKRFPRTNEPCGVV